MFADCGGSLNASKGNFSTPGFPKAVANATRCVWIVLVPATSDKKKTNIIEFSFDIEAGEHAKNSRCARTMYM